MGGALAAVLTLLAAAGVVAPARAASPGPPPLVVRYASPAPGSLRVLRPFAAPAQPWASGHRGADLASDEGATVLAPAAGTVAVAGRVVDRGVVTIAHPDGLRSSLEPVAASVVVGQEVAAGEPVGTLEPGPWHCAAACLHWGVRVGTSYVDPVALLPGAGPVVLLE